MNISGHVFLSYSRQDAHIVDRIRHTLERAGFPVWLDTQQLSPGAPNWEQAITQALDHAFAVVLIASPNAKASAYVQGEIAFAEANHKPIFPVWVSGDNWSRTLPLHLIRSQYVDARGEGFYPAMEQLIAELTELVTKIAHLPDEASKPDFVSPVPEGCVEVIDPADSTFLLDLHSTPSINDIIMQCFLQSAQKFAAPFTYGSEWLIVQTVFDPLWEQSYPVFRAAMGWELFTNFLRGSAASNSLQYILKEAAQAGFVPGTRWRIIVRKDFRLIGIAGVRRDVLFPGMMPKTYITDPVKTLLERIEKVRDAALDYTSYLEKATRTTHTIMPVKSFRADKYMENFDLFILQDTNNRLAKFHGSVLQFSHK